MNSVLLLDLAFLQVWWHSVSFPKNMCSNYPSHLLTGFSRLHFSFQRVSQTISTGLPAVSYPWLEYSLITLLPFFFNTSSSSSPYSRKWGKKIPRAQSKVNPIIVVIYESMVDSRRCNYSFPALASSLWSNMIICYCSMNHMLSTMHWPDGWWHRAPWQHYIMN